MDSTAVLARIRDELARGEYLAAYDVAIDARTRFPGDPRVRYLAVLALARAGALAQAAHELDTSGLGAAADGEPGGDPQLAEDVAALGARLAKDRALLAVGVQRRQCAEEAARRYEVIYRTLGRPYSCINAATMWLAAGDTTRARTLAREARRLVAEHVPNDDGDAYWSAATEAEAALVLGDVAGAAAALSLASRALPNDVAVRAVTRKQLRLVCELLDVDTAVLADLAVPAVIHYCGHRLPGRATVGRSATGDLDRIVGEVDAYLDARDVGYAYGSLAAGADLLIAQAVLRRGAELHVFVPFAMEEFVAVSVAASGPEWVGTFEHCIARAASVTQLDDGPSLGDDTLFAYCAEVAMGRAAIRARFLDAPVEQLALWDGRAAEGGVGTSADVARWRASGRPTHVLRTVRTPGPPRRGAAGAGRRVIRAMLFADFHGFSSLHDGHMALFAEHVLAKIAATLEPYRADIVNRRTWGDGLHVVFTGVSPAARCALDLQDAATTIDWASLGMARLGLRIGAHAGPVLEVYDAVRDDHDFTGAHIVPAARIEPRTPEGDVYVTDPFAALLELESESALNCEYVGHVPTAKDYGTFPMYVLRRRSSAGAVTG